MKVASKKEFRALALMLIVVFILEFFFGGVSVQLKTVQERGQWQQLAAAAAQKCGGIKIGGVEAVAVPHQICSGNADGKRNGTVCGPIPVQGGTLQGHCIFECCAAKPGGFTPAGDAISSFFGGSFLKGLAQGVVISTTMGLVGQLIGGATGGGGGSSSYAGNTGIEFRNAAEEEAYLQFSNDDLGGDVDIDAFELAFGNNNSEESQPTNTLAYGTGGETHTAVDQNSSGTQTNSTDEGEGDSVTTTYESQKTPRIGEGDVAPLPGEEGFEQDFFGASLNSSADIDYGDTLSLADLELEAEEVRRREALLNEQQQNEPASGLRDYRSSNIARSDSPVEVNPLSNTRYDDLEYKPESTEPTWWQQLVLFIGQLLGLAT